MRHNHGTWQNCSQVNLTSEESCQRINYKTKYKLESQNTLANNRASLTWEQLCQSHFGGVVLGNICASITWEQSYQSVSPGNKPASVICCYKKKWM